MTERKPLRHDATGRMIRDWKSERKSCGDLEVAYANAGAQEFIAGEQKEKARVDLANKQHKLSALIKKFSNELGEETKAGTIGGVLGGALGAYIAGRAGFAHNTLSGLAGMMLGAGEGSGVLGTLATMGEEGYDEIFDSGSRRRMEMELSSAENAVEQALINLEHAQKNYTQKKEKADQAFKALSECRRNAKKF